MFTTRPEGHLLLPLLHISLDLLTKLVNIIERRVALEVSFDDADLAKMCRNEREMLRKCGAVRARKLQQRLKTLRAAETLADMRSLPGRCHELHGDLAGHLSLDLDHPYRLLFRPADVTRHGRGGGLDWSAVLAVVVVGIADTHN